MRATRYDAEARYELFSRLRAANLAAEFDEIMQQVFEIEEALEQKRMEEAA